MAGRWNLVERRRSATFEEFWRQWAEDDLDVSDALATLYQNTIDRGYRDPLPAGASLRRPAPGPHNYALTTTRRGWSVVALRPANGDDLDLGLFDDRVQRQLLALSREGGDRIDFVAIDSNQGRRPLPDDYYPQVTGFGETGPYDLQLADPGLGLLTERVVPVARDDVATVLDTYLCAFDPIRLRVVPLDDQTLDPELFLMRSTDQQAVQSRVMAERTASDQGPFGTEVLTYTPTASGWYGIVVTQKAGAGTGGYLVDLQRPGSTAVRARAPRRPPPRCRRPQSSPRRPRWRAPPRPRRRPPTVPPTTSTDPAVTASTAVTLG